MKFCNTQQETATTAVSSSQVTSCGILVENRNSRHPTVVVVPPSHGVSKPHGGVPVVVGVVDIPTADTLRQHMHQPCHQLIRTQEGETKHKKNSTQHSISGLDSTTTALLTCMHKVKCFNSENDIRHRYNIVSDHNNSSVGSKHWSML
jgi:hypothetical protein